MLGFGETIRCVPPAGNPLPIMAFEPPYLAHQDRPSAPTGSPVRTLLYVSSQGLVFKSAQAFESGTRLAIGLHLRKICGDLGISEDDNGLYGDRFLQLEGVVADCKIVEASPIERFYQVTLIFDQLSEGDRLLLSAVERSNRGAAPGQPEPEADPQFANPRQAQSFPGSGGLN